MEPAVYPPIEFYGLEAELAEAGVDVGTMFGGMVYGQKYDHAAGKLCAIGSV
jgi:hypothetical protein